MLSWVNLHQSPCRLGGTVGVPTDRLNATEKRNQGGWWCSSLMLSIVHLCYERDGSASFSDGGDLNPPLPCHRERLHHWWGCKRDFGESRPGQVGQRCERKEMRECLLLHQWWHVNWSKEQRLCLLIALMNVIPPAFLWHSEHSPVPRKAGKASKKGEKVLFLKNPGDWMVMHIPAESEMCA